MFWVYHSRSSQVGSSSYIFELTVETFYLVSKPATFMHVFPLPHTHKSSTREKGEKNQEKICLSILLYNCSCLSAQYYCPSVHLSFCYCTTSKTHLLFHLFYQFVQSVFFFYPLSFKVFFVYLFLLFLSLCPTCLFYLP